MIQDRNKSELTRKATAAAARYLDEHGCKPIETEVPVADGWIADLASVIEPTATELVSLKLMRRCPRYKPGTRDEYKQWWAEAKEMQQLLTVLVEVKTSRSDFRGDRKWLEVLPVNLAYLAIPKSVKVKPEEWPQGWGVLMYDEAKDLVRCVRAPQVHLVSLKQQRDAILAVAVRREHHTRYERLREFQREQRIDQVEEKSVMRIVTVARLMHSIAKGEHGSVQGALEWHRVKGIPKYFMPELEALWPQQAGKVGA